MSESVAGRVSRTSIRSLERSSASDQSQLDAFGGEKTYIGIVSIPNDSIESETDELDPRLAPPDELFYSWLNTRDELDMPKDTAHDVAFEHVAYANRYRKYVLSQHNDVLHEYADRVTSGETVCFVCFCKDTLHCHADIVVEMVRERV
jgi:uncharacterized protein YeaO (DUF488 family)